jgi:hypothetical protein
VNINFQTLIAQHASSIVFLVVLLAIVGADFFANGKASLSPKRAALLLVYGLIYAVVVHKLGIISARLTTTLLIGIYILFFYKKSPGGDAAGKRFGGDTPPNDPASK